MAGLFRYGFLILEIAPQFEQELIRFLDERRQQSDIQTDQSIDLGPTPISIKGV
jgi:hypothetical protein